MRHVSRSMPFLNVRIVDRITWGSLFAIVVAAAPPLAAGEPALLPRLAVVISVDQGCAAYLDRFAPFFVAGGFARLKAEGANFVECHYEHAGTKTAPGHATVLTGTYPAVHGIVANDWLRSDTWETVSNVLDPEAPVVGGPAEPGRSPRQLLASTVGDQLKLRYGAAAKVFAVANKDRAAILPGGKLADGAFWLGENDQFVSSRYYFPDGALPPWLVAYNAENPITGYFGRTWDRLLDAGEYVRVQGPDDAPGEFEGLGLGRTFPHTITGGTNAPSPAFSDAFDRSPYALEIITSLARALVEAEQLGADDVPDLLGIGFSQIDTVGHSYGPDSHEVMDSFLRLDRMIAELLDFFDAKVGAGRYVVVVTADHGVSPLPERVLASGRGLAAGRVSMREVDRLVTAALVEAFGSDPDGQPWCRRDNSGYRLRRSTLTATGTPLDAAAAVVKRVLLQQPMIAAVFTADEIAKFSVDSEGLASMFRRGQYGERSPDVAYALAPYHFEWLGPGTTHGSPYNYDTHVPLLWFGPGVPAGRFVERVGVTDLAPTLAPLLGVLPPPESTGRRLF